MQLMEERTTFTLQGHTMIFNKPLLIVFGGNNGQQACDDQGSAPSVKERIL